MSVKTQAKVLRVLQEQVVEPVGGTSGVRVDVRVLAATNKELPAEIRAGRFREDLYFRLNVIPIFVPRLRDRKDDIPLLAEHFMIGFAREYGRRTKTLDPGAVAALQDYPWPGNVRELRNVIERLVIMVPGDTISGRDLTFLDGPLAPDSEPEPLAGGDSAQAMTLQAARSRFEREFILKTLAAQSGNVSRTADVLGVERSNLYRKMRALRIVSRPADRDDEPVV
jgi:two-component system nitrogen regulation response regulator NtrX